MQGLDRVGDLTRGGGSVGEFRPLATLLYLATHAATIHCGAPSLPAFKLRDLDAVNFASRCAKTMALALELNRDVML